MACLCVEFVFAFCTYFTCCGKRHLCPKFFVKKDDVDDLQIEKYEKDERLMKLGLSKTDYPFDYFFAKACSERAAVTEDCDVACDDNDDDVSSSDSDSELAAVSEAACSDGKCHSPDTVAVTE